MEKLSSKRQPTVELVVDLWRSKTNENGFLVIGGPAVDNVQLKLPNDNIMYRDKWNRIPKQLALTNFLLNERFEDFKITERSTSITIDDKVLRIIQENLVDMVVYAEEASIERCNIFEIIQPRFNNINYMLREVDRGDRDNSLNRCSIETTGCIPEQFKLRKPTPVGKNDCSGAFFTLTSEASELI